MLTKFIVTLCLLSLSIPTYCLELSELQDLVGNHVDAQKNASYEVYAKTMEMNERRVNDERVKRILDHMMDGVVLKDQSYEEVYQKNLENVISTLRNQSQYLHIINNPKYYLFAYEQARRISGEYNKGFYTNTNIYDKATNTLIEIDRWANQIIETPNRSYNENVLVRKTLFPEERTMGNDLVIARAEGKPLPYQKTSPPAETTLQDSDTVYFKRERENGYTSVIGFVKNDSYRLKEMLSYQDGKFSSIRQWFGFTQEENFPLAIPTTYFSKSYDKNGEIRRTDYCKILQLTIGEDVGMDESIGSLIQKHGNGSFEYVQVDSQGEKQVVSKEEFLERYFD